MPPSTVQLRTPTLAPDCANALIDDRNTIDIVDRLIANEFFKINIL